MGDQVTDQSKGGELQDVFDLVTLSLISHTNIGKTTLARTLLRQDIGEVLDKAHVTDVSTYYNLIENNGSVLRLWDTPGFGDTVKLLNRLKKEKNPLSWIVREVWDRFKDRALWCSQQAVKNIRDEADVVLYLVNASESPDESSYVCLELEILELINKPVIIILNQIGIREDQNNSDNDIQEWRDYLNKYSVVKNILHLDAFTRCWTQEHILLDKIEVLLNTDKLKIFRELSEKWKSNNLDIFYNSLNIFSDFIANILTDGQEVSKENFLQKIGIGRDELNLEMKKARQNLVESFTKELKIYTDKVISINGLDGNSKSKDRGVRDEYFGLPEHVDESIWTAVGGVVSGVSGGLVADILSGGLSFGGGAILGGMGGGVASFLLAKGLNLSRGADNRVRWSVNYFNEQFKVVVLTYLAIAHFGRGQGNWKESKEPENWKRLVDKVLLEKKSDLKKLWEMADKVSKNDSKSMDKLRKKSEVILVKVCQEILLSLYPISKF